MRKYTYPESLQFILYWDAVTGSVGTCLNLISRRIQPILTVLVGILILLVIFDSNLQTQIYLVRRKPIRALQKHTNIQSKKLSFFPYNFYVKSGYFP